MKFVVLFAVVLATASAVPAFLRKNKFFPDGRIVGGDDIPIEQVPWQISLQYYGSHMCGGSVISEKYVITAGHCTEGVTEDDINIRAGTSIRESGGQEVKIAKIHHHPKYDGGLIDYDISILELATPLTLSDKISPVKLPEANTVWPDNIDVLISGWGTTEEGSGSLPSNLQGVTVQIVSPESCKKAYGADAITTRMICAGVNGGGKDSCQGDSGGPLVVPNADNTLGGIVSWGAGCARPQYPGVYSNVAALRDFITEVTGL
ncbi:serine protease P80 [Tribolium castaneum]|uniref:Serine protease P80 n=1 Tax=Tribolium castaneum TaxID=7070 RepID=D2A2R7_TRICA|nr:PREDICTED: trypsin-3 [Tribolium castaneum]EFA02919.1 serine protease P80 [Tribolium castaneum]|eukprot:XP_967253.1 PREDICTED: trypsin-3 [Tribolium castaneum]